MNDQSLSRRFFLSAAAAAPAVPALIASDRIAIFDPPPDRIRIVTVSTSYAAPAAVFTPEEVKQMQAQGKNLQTFETGPVLFSSEDAKTGQKTEVSVVHDGLHGDVDDLVVAFQVYKDGQPQLTVYRPQLTLSMKQEESVWKLNEISFTVHLPLADPEFLKALTEKMTPQVTSKTSFTPRTEQATPAPGSDAMVLGAMRSILTAEVTYAANYPNIGVTCTLSDLDGFGGGQPNEHQAMLISSSLASGKRYGYVFTLSGCNGSPATAFHLTAVPSGNTFGRKTFCADQSAVIKASDNGKAAACLASGTPVQ